MDDLKRLERLVELRDLQLDTIADALERGEAVPHMSARIRFAVPTEEDFKRWEHIAAMITKQED